ncbi:aspartate--tRNA(Asn) ligase, partial [Candidatus Thorarchaeota archaeon]
MMSFYEDAGVHPIGAERTHYTIDLTTEDVGEEVVLFGWVHILRDKGGIKFLILRDERGLIQVAIPQKKVPADVFETSGDLGAEYAVEVRGKVVASKFTESGIEILPTELKVINKAERLPIDVVEGKADIDLDTRLNYRILDLRKPRVNAVFRVQHCLARFSREYLEKEGFVEIHTPKIVAESTEGGANLFEIRYFERPAYLAQSPQFYKQLMLLAGFGKVFEIGPVFRAEKHNTRRHINEYTSFDLEMAWISGLEDVMEVEEQMLHYAFEKTASTAATELELLGVDLEIPSLPFKRIKYSDVIELLRGEGKEISIQDDLDPESERILGEVFPERFGTNMVFITHYPLELRPAYTMPSMTDEGMTESFDLT